MRENRQSGSEVGAILQSSLPLSFIESLRDKVLRVLCGLLCERKLGNKPLELQNLPYSLDLSLQIVVDIESFLEPADSHADSRISGIAGG